MVTDPRVRLITEAQLQEAVIDAAHVLGLYVAHFRPAKTAHGWRTPVAADGKGWPDLVIVGTGVLYRELKRESERQSKFQRVWEERLVAAGADFDVWRPSHWLSGRIESELREIAWPVGTALRHPHGIVAPR